MTSISVYNESPDTELNANRNFKYETVTRRQQTDRTLGNRLTRRQQTHCTLHYNMVTG
jgi:hypothetical protein